MTEQKQYTFEEVKKASDKVRTVMVIHDKVFDVTAFLNEHPGGEEILLDHGGKDASEDFNDVGHSTDALEMMNKYQIGEIVEAERRNPPKKEGWKSRLQQQEPREREVRQWTRCTFRFAGRRCHTRCSCHLLPLPVRIFSYEV